MIEKKIIKKNKKKQKRNFNISDQKKWGLRDNKKIR